MIYSDVAGRYKAIAGIVFSFIMCGAMLAGLLLSGAAIAIDVKTGAAGESKNAKDIVLAAEADPVKVPVSASERLPEVTAFAGALSDIGLHLLRADAVPATGLDNRLVSPFGVASVLGVLHAGASGMTADEIAAVLQPSVSKGRRLGERMKAITHELNTPRAEIEIISANRLWVDAFLAKSISPAYAQLASENYRADGVLAHFSDIPASVATINQWVTQATRGKIKELVTSGSLQASTRVLATSAIYMKSAWAEPFNVAATRNLPFYPQSGQETSVPTMAGMLRVSQGSYQGLRIVEIPYADGDFVFYVAQPQNPGHTLSALQQDVNGLDIAAWPQIISPVTAEVYLPKFRIDPQPVSLKEALLSAGMRTAFSDGASFEGITGKAHIALDNVLHSAGIVVDEKGSEASAATAAMGRVKSLPTVPLPQIRIDRPFLFVVMHKPSATPLFIGRVSQPRT